MATSKGSVVTIGAFDGLHLGHRRVIEDVARLAGELGLESVVVTFDRHPASVVRPESAPLLLTDLDQKLALLHTTPTDHVEVIPFTRERANESAEDFVTEVLVGELSARVVVVGRDFHFGRGREGNVALLEKMGQSYDFSVIPFDLVGDSGEGSSGEIISSTRIRGLIEAGDLEGAAALLGRPHEVRGVVAAPVSGYSGAGEGSESASVEVPEEILLPPPGGYKARAGRVETAGGKPPELADCHVMVPAGGSLAVLGVTEPWPPGTAVRVLFEAPE
ncbi:MAG: adenylyltransferase/cytidyltransferase family protein [Acidimicrobiales bacterium]